MLVEINYQAVSASGTSIVAKKLVREEDITSVDPKPDDANKSVIRIKGSGSAMVQTFTDFTMAETYASFVSRYSSATSGTRVIAAPAIQSQAAS